MKYVIMVMILAACGEPYIRTIPKDGINGADGSPGTVITVVQLCPANYVATYPTIFPESALCIGNKLYGVYSANGGFLAELPSGVYSSNGINASCTFTIGNDCAVK